MVTTAGYRRCEGRWQQVGCWGAGVLGVHRVPEAGKCVSGLRGLFIQPRISGSHMTEDRQSAILLDRELIFERLPQVFFFAV